MNITKFLRATVAMGVLFFGIAHTASADIVTHTGDTTGGPTLDLTPWEFPGSEIPYKQFSFTVDTAGEYTFQVTATYDSVILLFENSFDPTDPVTNSITGNDDDVSSTTSAFAAELVTGTTYHFIVTGFDDASYGYYSATIGGPGVITAVPEPSTWLMLGLGLAAVGYAARRKSQHG